MNCIEIKNLTKIFGRKKKQALQMVKQGKKKAEILKKTGCTVAVYEANFEIQEGEIFVIMGLSGSGKSTLVRMLNRLVEPTSGAILLNGEDISKMDDKSLQEIRRKKINMVFQNFGLFPHLSIFENAEYALKIRGVQKEKRKELVEKALQDSGLLAFRDQYPDQLSGGMKQRVGLARAMVNQPNILLMDEAFSALDPLIRKSMQDELLELQLNIKKTIIFITHDLNEALRIGDRIAIMKDGHIVQIGTGEEILTNPSNQFVEDFVEEVDRSKILTAGHVMIEPILSNIEIDGPHVALKRMRKEGVSMLVAVDRNRRLIGSITAENALKAIKEELLLSDVVENNVISISKDMLVTDIFPLIYNSQTPLAVIENEKVVGVLVKGCIIEALANNNSKNIPLQMTEGGESHV